MKKVIVMFMAVVVCSLSMWSQPSVIIPLGDAVLSNNTFTSAKTLFQEESMTLTLQSSTRGVFMEGTGDFSLMAVVEANSDGKIKEVSFLCGAMYRSGLDKVLSNNGYKLIKNSSATLKNGATVPQKTYSNGRKRCLVQTLDNSKLQIIFKRQVTKAHSK